MSGQVIRSSGMNQSCTIVLGGTLTVAPSDATHPSEHVHHRAGSVYGTEALTYLKCPVCRDTVTAGGEQGCLLIAIAQSLLQEACWSLLSRVAAVLIKEKGERCQVHHLTVYPKPDYSVLNLVSPSPTLILTLTPC